MIYDAAGGDRSRDSPQPGRTLQLHHLCGFMRTCSTCNLEKKTCSVTLEKGACDVPCLALSIEGVEKGQLGVRVMIRVGYTCLSLSGVVPR